MAFLGLNIAKSGLQAHQRALDVTGHNIANANTEGYSRQRITMMPGSPLTGSSFNRLETPGSVPTGVDIHQIERIRDAFLDNSVFSEKGNVGSSSMELDVLKQIEDIYNEPGDNNIRTLLDKFWQSWQQLANNPQGVSEREQVKQSGIMLTNRIKSTYEKLQNLQWEVDSKIKDRVSQINNYIQEIAGLNEEIIKVKSLGDNPNDLMDQRDILIGKLSEQIDLKVIDSGDEHIIQVNGKTIVQNNVYSKLKWEVDLENYSLADLYWEDTYVTDVDTIYNQSRLDQDFTNGEIGGLIKSRDDYIANELLNMDDLAIKLISETNAIHNKSYNLNSDTGLDFFKPFDTYSINSEADNPYLLDHNSDTARINQNLQAPLEITEELLDTLSTAERNIIQNSQSDPDVAMGLNTTLDINNKTITIVATDSLNDISDKINNSGSGVISDTILSSTGKYSLKITQPLYDLSAIYQVKANVGVADPNAAITNNNGGNLIINSKSVNYVSSDSLRDIAEKINKANTGVFASIYTDPSSGESYLTLTADKNLDRNKNYIIQNLSDNGNLFETLKILPSDGVYYADFYDSSPNQFSEDQLFEKINPLDSNSPIDVDVNDGKSLAAHVIASPEKGAASRISLSDEIMTDTRNIAIAAQANAPGDGTAALLIADLKYTKVFQGGTKDFGEYLEQVYGNIGFKTNDAENINEHQKGLLEALQQKQEEISGVSLDEELANMIKYQQGYNASAKMMSTMNEMLDTLMKIV